MIKYRYSAIINPQSEYSKVPEPIKKGLVKIIDLTRALYDIQSVNKGESVNIESYYYGWIVNTVEELLPYMDEEGREEIKAKIKTLSGASFDIIRIPFISNSFRTDLLFGKVISPENNNEKRYAAAVGFPDTEHNIAVQQYDTEVADHLTKTEFPGVERPVYLQELKSDFGCLVVVMLAGELNRNNKPISLFYSRDQGEDLSALSKVALFTNLYFYRFELLSRRLGMKYIDNFGNIDEVSVGLINRILLYWLRGHDNGHSIGADNLGRNMKENRFRYYALHELKSDIISLYILSELKSICGKKEVSPEVVYHVFIAEVLRYIRRGDPDRIPDTASARLALNFFLANDGVSFNAQTNLFTLNTDRLKKATTELCKFLMKIFREGDPDTALRFYDEYIDLPSTNMTGFITDPDIPFFIDLNQD